MSKTLTYAQGILNGFEYLLENYPDVFVMGQGVWSPWYVGSSMKDLEKKFGKERVIDTPVSEGACNGIGVGASLYGKRPIVVHPRMDFLLYGMDSMVNQAAKWASMLGGKGRPNVTFRAIINRGGEQGAQHSQALHAWFAHVPGLRVVMPATPLDARDLLISSVLSDDPVVYIDDRWLYETEEEYQEPIVKPLHEEASKILKIGTDLTLVGSGYTTKLCLDLSKKLSQNNLSSEVIDIRILNPLKLDTVFESVKKTGNLVILDGGWSPCGLAGEIIAQACETLPMETFKSKPKRFTLPFAPAPSSKPLEEVYYHDVEKIKNEILKAP
jgi:pyruvate dehydrogenase E1 component beta subunit